MSQKSAIGWTGHTWNPVVGCDQVSPGCAHCYAKTIHDRRHKAHNEGKKVAPQYAVPFESVQLIPERLREPLSRREPTLYFVNSVSDLFHKDVPDEFLDSVFAVMALAHHHTFQVLTKRPERMRSYLTGASFSRNVGAEADNIMDGLRGFAKGVANHATAYRFLWFDNPDLNDTRTYPFRLKDEPLPNVWLGVSIENQRWTSRIPELLSTPAAVRFLSCEPLLGPLDLVRFLDPMGVACPDVCPDERFVNTDDYKTVADDPICRHCGEVGTWTGYDRGIDWVIVGGESGDRARPMDLDWARSVRDQCVENHVPFFLKQLGGETQKRDHEDAVLDGHCHTDMPARAA